MNKRPVHLVQSSLDKQQIVNKVKYTSPKTSVKVKTTILVKNSKKVEEEEEEEINDEIEKNIELEEEIKKKKCSLKEHEEIEAIIYCQECKIYMCNKCLSHHSQIFKAHKLYNLDNNIIKLFSDICKEKNHGNKLEYFCEDHNMLCCAACIAKIHTNGNGKHKNCNVCSIKKIKSKKKNKLNENIKYLEELSKSIDKSINELKTIFENINKDKEKLKEYVQKTFTKIRNAINEREDQLLSDVDKIYDELFFKEELIKQSETIPKKIKIEDNEWDNKDKLNSLIYYSICIENNIKEINMINDNMKNAKSNINSRIYFTPNEKEINEFIENIKKFGNMENKKGYDEQTLQEMVNKIDDEYNILTLIDEDEVKNKILELNFDEAKVRYWIECKLNE